MITTLTKEQEGKIPFYRDKWLAVGKDTSPITMDKARPIIDDLYVHILQQKPPLIIILNNPIDVWIATVWLFVLLNKKISGQIYRQIDSQISGQIYRQIDSQISGQISGQIDSQISGQIYRQIYSQMSSQICGQIDNFIWPYLDGQFWANYFGYYEFFFNELIKCENEKYKYFKATTDLHLIYPFKDICVLCQKPKKIVIQNGLLHNPTGASIEYEGFSVYSLNGVRVHDWLVLKKDTDIDPAEISKLQNADERREFVRKVGYDRIYYKLGGKTLDKKTVLISNGDKMFEHKYEVIQLAKVNWVMLKMINPSLSLPDNEVCHIEGLPPNCNTVEKAINFRKPPGMAKIPVSENGEEYWQQGDVCVWPRNAKKLRMYPSILT